MWKQLTQKARKAIFLAQEEAGRLGYSHVGPEHLLLALAREEDRIRALTAGFQLYLTKPIEPVQILEALRALVGRR